MREVWLELRSSEVWLQAYFYRKVYLLHVVQLAFSLERFGGLVTTIVFHIGFREGQGGGAVRSFDRCDENVAPERATSCQVDSLFLKMYE